MLLTASFQSQCEAMYVFQSRCEDMHVCTHALVEGVQKKKNKSIMDQSASCHLQIPFASYNTSGGMVVGIHIISMHVES